MTIGAGTASEKAPISGRYTMIRARSTLLSAEARTAGAPYPTRTSYTIYNSSALGPDNRSRSAAHKLVTVCAPPFWCKPAREVPYWRRPPIDCSDPERRWLNVTEVQDRVVTSRP